jgi:ABC-type transporter Mla MlaB component
MSPVTREAGTRPGSTDEATPAAGAASSDAAPVADTVADRRGEVAVDDRSARQRGKDSGDGAEDEAARRRPRLSLPLVPVLGGLLVLLLAATAFLWLTRPEASAVRTGDYVEALQAARSGVVDVTSFDHLTLDDDIEQIRRVATGDLREEAVAQLEDRRQELIDSEAVVNTEVVGAGVTRADESAASVLMVIQSTQRTAASPQAEVVKYRIQVELTKVDGRWMLSGISGR